MKRRMTQQERNESKSHALLLEWGSGTAEIIEDGSMGDRVSGGERPMSAPEKYAHHQGRWNRLDKAVRRTHEQNEDLGRAIWWLYGYGMEPRDCVGRMVGKDPRSEKDGERLTVEDWKGWKDRRRSACALFLAQYEMLCALMQDDAISGAEGLHTGVESC